MTKLPIISPAKLEKLLFSIGFEKKRQKGSHAFYMHPDGRTTTISHHKGREIPRPMVRVILQEIDLNPNDFNKLLEEL